MNTPELQMPLIPLTEDQLQEHMRRLAHMHLQFERMEERHADVRREMAGEKGDLVSAMRRTARAIREQGEPRA